MDQLSSKKHAKNSESESRIDKRMIYGLIAVLGLAAIISVAFISGYLIGERKTAPKTDKNNPLSNLSESGRLLPKVHVGEVTSVSKDSVTIKTSQQSETLKLSDKTRLTRKAESLELASLKTGDRVTVFANNDGFATRIVLR